MDLFMLVTPGGRIPEMMYCTTQFSKGKCRFTQTRVIVRERLLGFYRVEQIIVWLLTGH